MKIIFKKFAYLIYQSYFCSKINKTFCSVASKGNELSNKKLCDYIKKVDEAQRSFLSQGLNYRTTDICMLVANSPAPQFYIYPDEALRQYALYKKGASNIHSETRRRMYAEIFARYEHLVAIMKASGQVVRMRETMQRVLNQEAPSFYYHNKSAIGMYYRFLRRKRKHI